MMTARFLLRWAALQTSLEKMPLHRACFEGNIKKVKRLIQSGYNINQRDRFGWSPLQDAVEAGNTDIVILLLKAEAELESKDRKYGYTALHAAARNGNVKIAKLLLKAGARVTSKNKEKLSPLGLGKKYRQLKIVRVFEGVA